MRLGRFCFSVSLFVGVLALASTAGIGYAAVIGNWDQSARSWNNAHMTKVRAAMSGAGHRVDTDGTISASLQGSSIFLIGEPKSTPTSVELGLLRQFALRGGMILVFGDTGIDLPTYNNLLAGIGSTIAFTTTTIGTTSALPDGQFTQGPWTIAGSSLSVTSGNGTAGGTPIDSNYVRYEKLGLGYVVVFGDRIDHDDVISDTNTKLLLNLVNVGVGFVAQIPAVAFIGLVLVSLLLAGIGARHLARRRR